MLQRYLMHCFIFIPFILKSAISKTIRKKSAESERNLKISKKCENSKYPLKLDIQTGAEPNRISWKITQNSTNIIKQNLKSYPKNKQYELYEHEICLGVGIYQFNIENLSDPTSSSSKSSWYSLEVNNFKLKEEQIVEFGICENDSHCHSFFNQCGICNLERNICILNKMLDVKVTTVQAEMEFSSWDIMTLENNKVIFSKRYASEGTYHNCLDQKTSYRISFSQNSKAKLYVNGNLRETSSTLLPNVKNYHDIICNSDADCDDKNDCTITYCNAVTKQCSFKYKTVFTPECRSFGSPKVLALKVVAGETLTTMSLRNMRHNIFGSTSSSSSSSLSSSNSELNLKSQLKKCSFDKFIIEPFTGLTQTNIFIEDGAAKLHIFKNVTGMEASEIVGEVLEKASKKFGNLEEQFDLLMICLPPGTVIGSSSTWKGYAQVNHYLSVYNNENCNYPSVQMHEIGHNLGLAHSNDEISYGDESGYMGFSYNETDEPFKCFNAPKSWRLGWYFETHLVLNIQKDLESPIVAELLGITDYNQRSKNDVTIIKLINSDNAFDYFVNYNRNSSINQDTTEGINHVLITKCESNQDYEDSKLISRLSLGQRYNIFTFDNDKVIQVMLHDLLVEKASAQYAEIIISSIPYQCHEDFQCHNFNTCTKGKCLNSMCEYKTKECSKCGALTTVDIMTNDVPEYLFWKIENTDKNSVVSLSSGYFTNQYELVSTTKCLEYGNYMFSLSYNRENTKDDIWFNIHVEDQVVSTNNVSDIVYIESLFTICNTDDDCFDSDGCSVDVCMNHLCQFQEMQQDQECFYCHDLIFSLNFDNYPDETTWSIQSLMDTGIMHRVVMSGDPYFISQSLSGRRKAPTKFRNGREEPLSAMNNKRRRGLQEEADEATFLQESICLETGLYYFSIEDSFGDGICCSQGKGSFELILDETILIQGGDFTDKESLKFSLLSSCNDSTCDDKDGCTIDKCISSKLCTHIQRPCYECGIEVTIEVQTDSMPIETSWHISKGLFNGRNNIISAGPFESSCSSYVQTKCIPFGEYEFLLFDTYSNGFIGNDSNCDTDGGCIVRFEQEIVKTFQGNFGSKTGFIFDVLQVNKAPTQWVIREQELDVSK